MVITLQLLSWCDAQPDKYITKTHKIFSMHTKKSKVSGVSITLDKLKLHQVKKELFYGLCKRFYHLSLI